MSSMFGDAITFDQPMVECNAEAVVGMSRTVREATAHDRTIGEWEAAATRACRRQRNRRNAAGEDFLGSHTCLGVWAGLWDH